MTRPSRTRRKYKVFQAEGTARTGAQRLEELGTLWGFKDIPRGEFSEERRKGHEGDLGGQTRAQHDMGPSRGRSKNRGQPGSYQSGAFRKSQWPPCGGQTQ